MNKRFSYDNMLKSRLIVPNDIIRTYKIDKCCDFLEEKYKNPRLTQKGICNRLQFSDRTIGRYRDDIKMHSPYRINNNKKKTPKQKPSTITENIFKSVSNKKSKNNVIKGGNISDIHTISAKELIDHAFESDKVNSILENKQDDSSKFITIARKILNNN